MQPNRSDKSEPFVLRWEPFPARRRIARGTVVIGVLLLLLLGHQQSAIRLLFSAFVMDLLENFLDIIEYKSSIRTGVFNSKIKYFIFWDGGTVVIWWATKLLFPDGMKNFIGIGCWLVLLILHFLTLNSASEAAAHRAIKLEQPSDDK